MKRIFGIFLSLLLMLSLFTGCKDNPHINDTPPDIYPGVTNPISMETAAPSESPEGPSAIPSIEPIPDPVFHYEEVPEYTGQPWVEVNGNTPYFNMQDVEDGALAFETYSNLDNLNRCGVAYASLHTELMPTEPRGEIGMIRPSGWHTVRYDDLIKDKYLYNRCHLIGFQLAGENANELNLITGTRAMNVDGMLPFENQVAGYIEETENHVLYRVTPVFIDDELVARGVLMEGYSIEDWGDGICFCVFCYNNQPGILIDYTTGESWKDPNYVMTTETQNPGAQEPSYIINQKSGKFHSPNCSAVESMSESNKTYTDQTRAELIATGYVPCSICKP